MINYNPNPGTTQTGTITREILDCPKCGSEVKIHHCSGNCGRREYGKHKEEKLHSRCKRCGYKFLQDPLDKTLTKITISSDSDNSKGEGYKYMGCDCNICQLARRTT